MLQTGQPEESAGAELQRQGKQVTWNQGARDLEVGWRSVGRAGGGGCSGQLRHLAGVHQLYERPGLNSKARVA